MIDGNITATIQVCVTLKNEIGEPVKQWHDVMDLTGWLDLSGGDAKYTVYHAKTQESTHVFICDYRPIPDTLKIDGKVVRVDTESVRMMINSKRYDIMLIDDPMELHQQLEIYLKYTGGQVICL